MNKLKVTHEKFGQVRPLLINKIRKKNIFHGIKILDLNNIPIAL